MRAWAIVWSVMVSWPCAVSANEASLTAAASFPLVQRHHGLDGAVVLMTDRRVGRATLKALQDFQWFGFGAPPALDPPVEAQPLLDARLDLVRDTGHRIASLALGTPFAELNAASLLPGRGRQFVLETATGGFGQVTGTTGRPFAVESGRIGFLATPAGGEIRLLRAQGTDWMVLPATNGKPGEILQASCRPGEAGASAFAQVLESWRLEGGEWHRRTTTSHGYCEWSPGLPPLSAFP